MLSSKHRILIIDEDRDLHDAIHDTLDQNHFDCYSVFTVEDGMRKLTSEPFDLILLDICFTEGKLDGEAFLAYVRNLMSKDYILPPVIVTSSLKEKEIKEYVLDIGATEYVNKPLCPNALTGLVASHAW